MYGRQDEWELWRSLSLVINELHTRMPVGARLTGNLNVPTGQGLAKQEVVRPVAIKKVHDQ